MGSCNGGLVHWGRWKGVDQYMSEDHPFLIMNVIQFIIDDVY